MTFLQHRRDVALRDAQREAFHHRRLADARLAHQNGVVLAAAGQDVHHLADFEIARQHRVDLAARAFSVRLTVYWSRLGVLPPGRACGSLRLRPRRLPRRLAPRPSATIAWKSLRSASALDLLELFAGLADDPREFLVGDQRQDRVAGTHLARAEIDGAERPGLGQHFAAREGLKRRRARVAGLQLVEAARQFRGQARFVDPEMLRDAAQIVRPLESSSFIR